MSDPQNTVFISYRRSLNSYVARSILLMLKNSGYDVFMDVENIDSGNFDSIILRHIAQRAHFLVVCTPGAFDRCVEPGDRMRREIEAAMDQRRNIVPVLADGFTFEDNKAYLTGSLAELPRFNALPLYHEYFEEGMTRLRSRFLKQPFAPISAATPADTARDAKAQAEQSGEDLTAEEFYFRALGRSPDDLDGQIDDFSQALQLDPEFAWAFIMRGNVRASLGDLAAALADYDEAIWLNPDYGWTYINRGMVRANLGDLDAAIADYDQAILLDPKLAEAYNNRGKAHFVVKYYARAERDFEVALKLNPTYSAHAELAVALHSLRRVDEAQANWRRLVKVDSRYRDADWVGKEHYWPPEMTEAARRLIAELGD